MLIDQRVLLSSIKKISNCNFFKNLYEDNYPRFIEFKNHNAFYLLNFCFSFIIFLCLLNL